MRPKECFGAGRALLGGGEEAEEELEEGLEEELEEEEGFALCDWIFRKEGRLSISSRDFSTSKMAALKSLTEGMLEERLEEGEDAKEEEGEKEEEEEEAEEGEGEEEEEEETELAGLALLVLMGDEEAP